MDIQQTVLPSGLRVVTVALPGFASASVAAFVRAGARDESQANGGIAHFNEHMAFKGTSRRSALQIAREVEEAGSYINAYTSQDTTAYYINGVGQDVPMAVSILGDVLTDSLYDEREIAVEKGVILQEIAQYADDPMSIAADNFNSLAFPGQALGRPILGTPEFIKSVTGQHFRDFLADHYHTGNIVVVGSGNVEHQSFVEQVAAAFASLPRGTTKPRETAQYVGGLHLDDAPKFEQVSVLFGYQTVAETAANSMAHKLLADIYGGGMASPLFQQVREQRGLVYGTGSYSSQSNDYGLLVVNAKTTGENVHEFFEVASAELRKLSHSIEACDIKRAKNSFRNSYATRREKPFAMAQHVFGSLNLWGEIRLPESRIAAVESVSVDELRQAAQDAVAGNPVISLVGPAPVGDYFAMLAGA